MAEKKRKLKKSVFLLVISLVLGLLLTSLDDSCEQGYITESDVTASSAEKPADSDSSTGTGSTAAAANTANAANGPIAEISGKNWKLMEVKIGAESLQINRKKLDADGTGDFFTFSINDDRVSGRAAPNRYTAAYKTGDNNALTLTAPASTLMASIYAPEEIEEKEYFEYLIKVNRWKLNQGKLELYTTDKTGTEAIMVFAQ